MVHRRPLPFDPIAEAHLNWERAGWAEAADGMALVTSIARVHQLLVGRVNEVLSPFGVTFARYEVLMLLTFARRGSLPLGKIGERLQVHPASVTNVIDRLERDGLVRRVPHPSDRRATLAAITPAGRRLARQASASLNTSVFEQPGMAAEHLSQVVDRLTELRVAAGDFTPS